QLSVKLLEAQLLLFLVVLDRGDVRQRNPELAHPPDLVESEQVGGTVLLVAVALLLGLGEQTELVVVADRVYRGSGQSRQLARAPPHDQVPPPLPGSLRTRSSLCRGSDLEDRTRPGPDDRPCGRRRVGRAVGTVMSW